MWEELGISGGTAIIVLIILYFVIKSAVKNGIKQAYCDITGKETYEDKQWKEICKEHEDDDEKEEKEVESEEVKEEKVEEKEAEK